MPDAPLQAINLHGSRLVHLLTDMNVSNVKFSSTNISERLGSLIDIGDSMRLSALHDKLNDLDVEAEVPTSQTLKDEVLRVRKILIRSVVSSFSTDGDAAKIKLPTPEDGTTCELLLTFEPYHHFYLSHQREFDIKIKMLQLRIKDKVYGMSTELAQLVTLDEAIRVNILQQLRKNFSVIPKLLGKQFDHLLKEFLAQQTLIHENNNSMPDDEESLKKLVNVSRQENGWLNQFFKDMQGLLLAELELRLLPILGLIEAVDDQVGEI